MSQDRNPFLEFIPNNEEVNPFEDLIPRNKKPKNLLEKLKQAAPIVGKDIKEQAINLPSNLVKSAINIPFEALGVAGQMLTNPKRLMKIGAEGLGELEHGIANAPSNMANYLAKIGLIEPETAKGIWSQENIPFQGYAGEPMVGDTLVKEAIKMTPYLLAGEGLIAKGAPKITTRAASGGTYGGVYHGNPLEGAVGNVAGMGIAKGINAIRPKTIAKDIVKGRESAIQKYSKEYDDLFSKAEKEGSGIVEVGESINLNQIKKHATSKFTEALEDFHKNPTIRNAQKAQSDLGKLINEFDRKGILTSAQKKTYNAALSARKLIQENMFKKHPKLKKKYEEINSGYDKDVLTYKNNKSLKKYIQGKMSEDKLVRNLQKNDEFTKLKGNEHKGLMWNKKLKNIPLFKVGATGLLGSALLKYLLGGKE